MAFCPKGTCNFSTGKKSKKGYPQCSICGRVNLQGTKGKNKSTKKTTKKTTKKATKKPTQPRDPPMRGFRPMGNHRVALKGMN